MSRSNKKGNWLIDGTHKNYLRDCIFKVERITILLTVDAYIDKTTFNSDTKPIKQDLILWVQKAYADPVNL